MSLLTSATRILAWFLVLIGIFVMAGLLALEAAGCRVLFNPASPQPALAYGLIMLPLNNLAFALLGALIVTYQPRNRVGWISLIFGTGVITTLSGAFYGACSLEGTLNLPYGIEAIWLETFGNIFFVFFGIFPWVFPDGSFLSANWRRAGLTFLAGALFFNMLMAFWPGPFTDAMSGNQNIENPFALPIEPGPFWDSAVQAGGNLATSGLFLLGILSLVNRWWKAEGRVRQQIKWLVYFLMTSGVLFMSVEFIGEAFYPAIFDGWFYLIELLIFWLGFPVVLGLAVFRFRLYDIDLIIRRTLSYAVLTAVLALVYFGGIILLQNIFDTLVGQHDSPLITVASTLAIAALFNPLRIIIQHFIDRRFYRAKYDAEKALAGFATTARDEVDMNIISTRLLSVVAETVQPKEVQLLLKSPQTDKQN